jgi:epoxyqueuosine reductase QueG
VPEKEKILIEHLMKEMDVPIMGAADASKLDEKAPEGFRPCDLLPGAKTVLIFAKPLPLSIFAAPGTSGIHSFYVAAYKAYYKLFDDLAVKASLALQDSGFDSLPIPSYSPIRFHKGEPHGLISLKHAAAEAGIGKMGKNTLLINKEHGNSMRLGGVVTNCPITVESTDTSGLCPDKCRKCMDACPVGALSDKGIDKTKCMVNCVTHTMMPPLFISRILAFLTSKSRMMTRFMDVFTLSFFENYGISCFSCLKACPHFQGNR